MLFLLVCAALTGQGSFGKVAEGAALGYDVAGLSGRCLAAHTKYQTVDKEVIDTPCPVGRRIGKGATRLGEFFPNSSTDLISFDPSLHRILTSLLAFPVPGDITRQSFEKFDQILLFLLG